jgi:cytidyltransferase-like protein
MKLRVFVSGCYDLLHPGHIAFFKQASQYGDLYVGIGSDSTVTQLKRSPILSQDERLYLIKAIRYVKDAWISSGSGMLDFEEDIRVFRPDIFVVNTDGNRPEKAELCKELGIEYKVLERIPDKDLPVESTTGIIERVKKLL